jgi:hypothetical protein
MISNPRENRQKVAKFAATVKEWARPAKMYSRRQLCYLAIEDSDPIDSFFKYLDEECPRLFEMIGLSKSFAEFKADVHHNLRTARRAIAEYRQEEKIVRTLVAYGLF